MIDEAKTVLRQAGKHCGVLAKDNADLHRRWSEGFRMIGLGTDAALLIRSLRQGLGELGRDVTMRAELTPPTSKTERS